MNYYEVREDELIELLASYLKLSIRETVGSNNWHGYEEFQKYIPQIIENEGLNVDLDKKDNYSFEDWAKLMIYKICNKTRRNNLT